MKQPPRRYPWDKWFGRRTEGPTKGRKFVVTKGVDYDCMTHGMAQMIRTAAAIRRLRITVRYVNQDSLEVTVK